MKNPEDGESLDQFATEIKITIKECRYTDIDEMIRDRIVIGLRNPKIRGKLWERSDHRKGVRCG